MIIANISIIYLSVGIALWLYRFRNRQYTIRKMKEWKAGDYTKFDCGGRTNLEDIIFVTTFGSIIWPLSLISYIGKTIFGKLPPIVPPDRDEDYLS